MTKKRVMYQSSCPSDQIKSPKNTHRNHAFLSSRYDRCPEPVEG